MSLLEIKDLSIRYHTEESTIYAVNNAEFSLDAGKTIGLVGETGAGKTTTALGILQLVSPLTGDIAGGEIWFEGENLLEKKDRDMRKIRGEKISMIFQDPMTALNPVITVGDQIAEVIQTHRKCSRKEAWKQAEEMMRKVGIPAERAAEYPHQFSGGMRQRIVIAMALACNPTLLIADEPTSALDVTIQAQVLDMIKALQTENQTAMILITHDFGVVAEACDTVAIMYAGEIVEYGTVEEVFDHTAHPYTKGLMNAIPRLNVECSRLETIPGMMPDPADLPQGCSFGPRCKYATDACRECAPGYCNLSPTHKVKCYLTEEGGCFTYGGSN